MKNVNIKFYLYCEFKQVPPTYRIYLDDELVTERSYIWDINDHVLQENIPVTIDTSIPHVLRLEQLKPKSGKFYIKDLHTPYHSVIIQTIIN